MSKIQLYRFRNIGTLIEKNELENHYFYIGSIHELNDPMEGLSRVYWQGDETLWKSLIKHYLMTFKNIIVIAKEYNINRLDKSVIEKYTVLARDFEAEFADSKDEYIKECVDFAYHMLEKLCTNLSLPQKGNKMSRQDIINILLIINIMINNLLAEKDVVKFDCRDLLNQDLLTLYYKYTLHNEGDNIINFSSNFPEFYVDNILREFLDIGYFPICFMKNCENIASWGYYGDGHKGLCLIYEFEDNDIKFYNNKHQLLKSVNYTNELKEINYFESISMVDISMWYGKGNDPRIHEQIRENMIAMLHQKNKDWEKEEEVRCIISKKENEERLEYDLNQLKGVIFGLKTSLDDKFKIIKILENLTENKRCIFEVYEATYNETNANISKKLAGIVNEGVFKEFPTSMV